MKKLTCLMSLAIAGILLFTSCSQPGASGTAPASGNAAPTNTEAAGSAADGPKIHLKIGTNAQPGNMENTCEIKFAEFLAEKTGGRITAEVFDSAKLGDHLERMEGLRSGTLEMTTTSVGYCAQYVEELALFDLPYVFESRDHMFRVFDGEAGEVIDESLQEHGFKVLGFMDFGCRQTVNNVRPVATPADMKGLKIRVQETKASIDGLNAMGATATPMAFSEVYMALQQKVLDGAENSFPPMVSSKYYEVCKYLSLTNHLYYSQVILISDKLWNTFSAEDQAIIQEAQNEAVAWQRDFNASDEENLKNEMIKNGMQVNEADVPAFMEACAPLIDKYLETYGDKGKKLYDLVVAAKG